jgi:hypothetical protein
VHPQKRQFIHMKRTRMHCNYCPRDAGATSARTGIARLSFLCRLTNNRFYFPLVSVNGFRALFHWLFQCRPFAFSLCASSLSLLHTYFHGRFFYAQQTQEEESPGRATVFTIFTTISYRGAIMCGQMPITVS